MVERHKRLIRIFFNTYYDDVASELLRRLSEYGKLNYTRSKIVPELYYVELSGVEGDLEEKTREIERMLKDYDTVFGVKVYKVET
ncbi:MAG: hypothetical protein ABWW69_04390 [Pyrodictiaceae archaeon]